MQVSQTDRSGTAHVIHRRGTAHVMLSTCEVQAGKVYRQVSYSTCTVSPRPLLKVRAIAVRRVVCHAQDLFQCKSSFGLELLKLLLARQIGDVMSQPSTRAVHYSARSDV